MYGLLLVAAASGYSPTFNTDALSQSVARVLLPNTRLDGTVGHTVCGSACAVAIGLETYLLTSVALGARSSVKVQLPTDDFVETHSCKIVGVDNHLALLQLPPLIEPPPPLPFADADVEEGDFVLAVGSDGSSLGLLRDRAALPSLAAARGVYGSLATRDEQDDSEGQDDEQPPPAPEPAFLVTDAPEVQGASGGPLIDCDGRVVGINTYVLSAGEAHTRYYALSAQHAVEAANDILLWRQSIGKRKRGWRVVLLHEEGFQEAQRSARVRQVLAASGLSEEAAQFVLVAAHRTGRSVVRYTQLEEDAQKEAAFLSLYKLKVLVEPVQYWAP